MDQTPVVAEPVAAPPSRNRARIPPAAYPVGGLAATVFVWWLCSASVLGLVKRVVLPPPQEVARAFHDYVFDAALVTGLETLVGFLLSAAAAFLIGLTLASNSVLERSFSPLLVAVNAVPKIAFAPLLVFWLGFGQKPIQVMIFVMSFFPVVLSTVTGLTSTPAELAEMARSLDASRWQMFVKIRLPGALPQIFVGLKVALPLAAVGAIIGEFQAGDMAHRGLGSVIQQSTGQGDTATAYASFILAAATTIVLYYLLVGLERRVLPWVRETTDR